MSSKDNKIETVSIVGMGALGLLYGAVFTESAAKPDVTFIMDEERLARHAGDAYTVNGRPVQFKVVSDREAAPSDLVILAVKYPQLAGALDTMRNAVDAHTIIISVMNGITTEGILRERFPEAEVVDTVAQGMDAMKFGSDLTYTKMGRLHVGVSGGRSDEPLKRVIDLFERTGMPYVHEADILRRMWIKFMLNVGINQVCMVYNETYAVTDKENEANRTLVAAMREVEVLANAEGIPLTEADLNFCLDLERTLDPTATPSMGQDRINRKPSEVDLFAGTVIEMAKKHGILVPANRFLYKRAKEIEAEYVKA